MSGYGQKIQKVMVQPINLVFRFFQKKLRVQVSGKMRFVIFWKMMIFTRKI